MTTIIIIFSEFASGLNTSDLKITEIMFNPYGADTGREWIEIYDECDYSNKSCTNLSQYKLFQSSNHYIYPYNNITAYNYSIICYNCELFLNEYGPELNQTIAIYKSSFTLSNSGELIALKLNDSIIDEINYINFTNISEGYSLEFDDSLNSWRQSLNFSGSPGRENLAILIEVILENNTTLNYTLNKTQNYTINITTNITTNYTTNTTINMTDNNSINLTHNTTNYCNISINITLKNSSIEIYNNKESIKFYNKIYDDDYENKYNSTYNYSIEYWIEDLFETIVKSKTITANQNEKSYTPSIDEEDRILIIKNKLTINGCINTGIKESSKIILIKNPDYLDDEEGEMEDDEETISCPVCTSIYEDGTYDANSTINISKIEFNKGVLSSEIHIYKGNTRKSVIIVSVMDEKEKTIEEQKIKLNDKYSSVIFNFERKIDCYENKTLFLTAEGLDAYAKEKTILNCETTDKTATAIVNATSKSSKNTPIFSNNASQTSQITGQVVYESPNQKNKLYSFAGLILISLAGISFLGYKVYKLIKKKNEINNNNIYVDKNEEYKKTPI